MSEPAALTLWGSAFLSSPHRPLRQALKGGAYTVAQQGALATPHPSLPPERHQAKPAPQFSPKMEPHQPIHTSLSHRAGHRQVFRWIKKKKFYSKYSMECFWNMNSSFLTKKTQTTKKIPDTVWTSKRLSSVQLHKYLHVPIHITFMVLKAFWKVDTIVFFRYD